MNLKGLCCPDQNRLVAVPLYPDQNGPTGLKVAVTLCNYFQIKFTNVQVEKLTRTRILVLCVSGFCIYVETNGAIWADQTTVQCIAIRPQLDC